MQRTPRPQPTARLRRLAARLARPLLLSALLPWLGPIGCEDPLEAARAPTIEAVRPASAPSGAAITLIGRNFGLRGDRDRVWLGPTELTVESWTASALLVRLPVREPGLSTLVVRAGALVSAPYPFEVVAPPAGDSGPPDGMPDSGLDAGSDAR